MEWSKVLRLVSIILILLCIVPIYLVNKIPRGNFIAGPIIVIIDIALLIIQIILVIFMFNINNKKLIWMFSIINFLILIFSYWLLYSYIYKLS